MATVDKSTGAICKPAVGLGKAFVLHNYIDFTVAANQLAQTETMAIFDIPADMAVLYVLAKVATADADVSDVDVGIEGGNVDGFYDAMDVTTTGWKAADVDEAYSLAAAAPYLSASDTVVIVTNNDAQALNAAKIHFYAVCIDLSDDSTL